jgi:hypothetical protein
MAGTYASGTEVPVSRSFEEIKRTLQRFGATAFGYVEQGSMVGIQFELEGLRVVMRMTLPDRSAFGLSATGKARPESAIDKDWEQACRQRWRSLANGIKAKLAMVDDGISTVEREFLADVMTATGQTVGERLAPQLETVVRGGDLPPLMPGMATPAKVIALGERSGR